ncbi:hypothetical protein E2493_01900 [Sphingomonas parva]|uniref:Uncharacterized protein n=1 Tax=Sphingomonas parva TaxID=2555898 RepID=A0A4Y8ZZ70_9SPHN|nr:hypothetical protein [Sphingomonas parva]TFI60026.1 hypothetical protein E2493_01900 [Sphingomonas parva]
MLRAALFPCLFLALAGVAAAQRQAVGVYGLWGAFAEKSRCYAISEPQRTARNNPRGAFASVGWWPERPVRGQVHFRLSQSKRSGSAVLLRIDERTFQLVGGGGNAWAPDARADSDIVAAMRIGLQMTIETRSERGTLVRDLYALRGAASAIDAAAIACAQRR